MLDYFLFNLLYLDYFLTFTFGFGLSVHLKLTLKSGDKYPVTQKLWLTFNFVAHKHTD